MALKIHNNEYGEENAGKELLNIDFQKWHRRLCEWKGMKRRQANFSTYYINS